MKNSAINDQKCTSGLRAKYQRFLSDLNKTLIFSTDFPKMHK